MSYLSRSDLLECSLACKRWFDAAHFSSFLPSYGLHFIECTLDDHSDPIRTFARSQRSYTAIRIDSADIENVNIGFWRHHADTMRRIHVSRSDLRERALKTMLLGLGGVTHLTLEDCQELFIVGRLFEPEDGDTEAIRTACQHIEHLGLIDNRHLTDSMFERLTSIMPNLRSLDLTRCHISAHLGVYNKFYPARLISNGRTASGSVLTFQFISDYLSSPTAANLTDLNLTNTLVNGPMLQTICIQSGLRLDVLSLSACDQLHDKCIGPALQAQPQLRQLDISRLQHISDQTLFTIAAALGGLECLRAQGCPKISNAGVEQLAQLRALRVLDISECVGLTGAALMRGIAAQRNTRLQELHIRQLNVCQQSLMQTVEQLPELRLLDVTNCENGVTDLAVQWICRYARRLRVLRMSYCKKISDASLTGSGMAKIVADYEMNQQRKTTTPNDDPMAAAAAAPEEQPPPFDDDPDDDPCLAQRNPYQISLRSKAEQDIVNDAKRKQIMVTALERQRLQQQNADQPDSSATPYSIDNLRGLRELHLGGCSRISDVCLRYSMHLPELRVLILARCQQISSWGIEQLVRNCPALEHVDLSECHNVQDRTIELLAVHLQRLTRLRLQHCSELSDHTLDHLVVNCRRLSRLDVRGCRGMCTEPSARLVSLRTLRKCEQSKHGGGGGVGVADEVRMMAAAPAAPPLRNFFDANALLRRQQNR